MTIFGQLEEKSCKRSPYNNWLELDTKSVDLHSSWVKESFNDKVLSQARKPHLTKCNNSSLWATLLGIKLTMRSRNKWILPNSYTSMQWELYPNSQKMTPSTNASNKYEMRRDDLNKLAVLSRVNVQYSYRPQMTLTLCCQAQKWGTNSGWKRSLARCLAAVNDFSLMWFCHQEYIIVWSNYFNWPLVSKKAKRRNRKHQTSHNQNKDPNM